MRKNKVILSLLIISILCSSNIVISAEFDKELNSEKFTIKNFEKLSMFGDILSNSSVKIEYPLSTVPIIVEKGEEFTIRFTSDTFDDAYAYISTSFEPIVDEFWLIVDDIWFLNEFWHMNVTVPSIVPEELYNITIMLDQNGASLSASQPRSVSVVKEFTDDFSFIHITDFHVGDLRGLIESIRETIRGSSSLGFL